MFPSRMGIVLTIVLWTISSAASGAGPASTPLRDAIESRNWPAARRQLEEALQAALRAHGPESAEVAELRTSLGIVLGDMGILPIARQHLEAARKLQLRLRGPDDAATARTLNALAVVLYKQREYPEARRLLEQLLADHRKRGGPDNLEVARYLNNLAFVQTVQGDVDGAQRTREQAWRIAEKAAGPRHPETIEFRANLAGLLGARWQVDAACGHLEEVLRANEERLGPDHPMTNLVRGNLGIHLARKGDLRRAWDVTSVFAASAARQSRIALDATPTAEHALLLANARLTLDGLCNLAAGLPDLEQSELRKLQTAAYDWRRASTRSATRRREAVLVKDDAALRAQYQKLVGVRQELARRLLTGSPAPGVDRAALEDLARQRDRLELDLVRGLADRGHVPTDTASAVDVADRLPAGAVLLEVVTYHRLLLHRPAKPGNYRTWNEPHYAALLLGRPTASARPVLAFINLGPAEPINQAVRRWRQAVQDGKEDAPAEQLLRDRLWQPVAKRLPAETGQLLIAPDGELALLPWKGLRLNGGPYLVERLQISYLNSGLDLVPRPGPKGPPGPTLIVADPDYDAPADSGSKSTGKPVAAPQPSAALRSASLRFRRLPGFAAEASAVQRLLRNAQWTDVRLAQGRDASEETLAGCARPRLLYLITHGFFLPAGTGSTGKDGDRGLGLVSADTRPAARPNMAGDARLRSGLALAGANRWQERSERGHSDGLLTALEVEDLDLWGTELVVLSSCETGLGAVDASEGVLGLRRAFQLAGAQTVLASLWKVPDAETEQLMRRFFRLWLAGKSRSEALCLAQRELILALRKDGNEARRKAPPVLWAGFICHGRP